jgi:hypothetical protein
MFEDDRRLFAMRSRVKKPAGRAYDDSIFNTAAICRSPDAYARLSIPNINAARKRQRPRLEDTLKRLCWSRLCLIFQFMDEGKIGHHHAKCLGPIHTAENLSANSFQFIGNIESQRKHESGVDTLKWDVQPLVVIERNKLRLRGLALEAHDDVFSQGILSPDFEHGKKLVEMAFGEFGIDGEPELSAFLCG